MRVPVYKQSGYAPPRFMCVKDTMSIIALTCSFEEDCVNFHLIHVGVVEALYVRVTPEV